MGLLNGPSDRSPYLLAFSPPYPYLLTFSLTSPFSLASPSQVTGLTREWHQHARRQRRLGWWQWRAVTMARVMIAGGKGRTAQPSSRWWIRRHCPREGRIWRLRPRERRRWWRRARGWWEARFLAKFVFFNFFTKIIFTCGRHKWPYAKILFSYMVALGAWKKCWFLQVPRCRRATQPPVKINFWWHEKINFVVVPIMLIKKFGFFWKYIEKNNAIYFLKTNLMENR